jgi:nucleotide-binding universal stress UspA family protein
MVAYTPAEALVYSADLSPEKLEQTKIELGNYLGGDCPGITLTREVVAGDPATVIADYVRERDIGLIVMATHGYGPFRRFLLGSVTAKVLHDVACPVWTGPHLENAPDHGAIGFRRVLCAIDLARRSREVLCWAGRFTQEFGAELTVLHVLPGSLVQLGGVFFDPEWSSRAAAAARDRIARLQEEARTDGEVTVDFGDTPVVVSDVAWRRKADLVVIGRGSDSDMLGRLNANAYAILRESPCPVVTI